MVIFMEYKSIWLDGLNYVPSKSLDKDIDTDVLIIGGGITGLSTAYSLINKGLDVTLVEKNLIGHGITGKTTGKLTYLQELIYSFLVKTYDKGKSALYLKSQKEAISYIKDIIKNNNIECSFNEVKSYVFTNKEKEIEKIKKEKKLLEEFGVKIREETSLPDGSNFLYGISVPDTAVFDPLKYLINVKNICKNNKIKIYENSKVTSINHNNNHYECICNNYKINAKKVVLALHSPYFLFPYFLPLKTYLEKSYIAAFTTSNNLLFSAITSNMPTESIRYLDKDSNIYKICLSNSHNLAFKNNDESNFLDTIKSCNHEPSFCWSNTDLITSDKLPFIGRISNNLFLATGYNTWGMTNGTIAGKIISDLILGNENEYEKLFDPKRGINKNSILHFPIVLSSNLKSFIGSKINKNKSWYKNNVIFKNGLGIYIDEFKKEHIVKNKCPHLGCSLIFNELEKTWDCPCHGSRFDIDGNSIDGPSNYNIKIN